MAMLWLLLAVVLATLLIKYVTKKAFFWKERGVPQASLVQIAKMNWNIITSSQSVADFIKEIYNIHPDARYVGQYQFLIPLLIVKSPELIKQITVKDFDHFVDHQRLLPETTDPIWSKNLISLKGQEWRDMRATLSPSFTSSKMKAMFTLMSECAQKFTDYFVEDANNIKEFEAKDSFTRFANDVIASCAFGISCDSMRNKENEFYLMGRKMTSFSGFWVTFKFIMFNLCPRLMQFFQVSLFSKSATRFFRKIVLDNINHREKHGIVRPDMINLLMEARKGKLKYEEDTDRQNDTGFATVEESEVGKSSPTVEITDDVLVAQALIFFFAGFETVSTAMSFMAYELAVNPDVQQELYEEIRNILEETNGKVTYEGLSKMKYMDMVVSETLRKWTPGIATERVCVKPYTIKATEKNEKDLHLQKGESLFIPMLAIHHDPKYYPNPTKFDPTRFSDENKKKIEPYAFIPFGVGPRGCIGSRFALLEMKAGFFHLLTKFELVVIDKTPIPLVLSKSMTNLSAKDGFWVGLKLRQ